MMKPVLQLFFRSAVFMALVPLPVVAASPEAINDGTTAAFAGLAQAPEANLFVGSAATSIRIDVPPGRKDLTPKLSLTYNSSGGPSPYGLGWELPLGEIQRCSKHGVLVCDDPTYRNDFVLALPSANVECRLDLAAGSRNARPCTPAIDESQVRILYDEDLNRWDVWDKSGLHYLFGATSGARTGSDVGKLFTAGASCRYTFSWAIEHIEDPNGNGLDLVYSNIAGVLYPESIAYGANRNINQPHVFEVNFDWSDEAGFARPESDQPMNALGGFPATLARLLSKIVVRFRPNGVAASAAETIRSYGFLYDFQVGPDPLSRSSLLSAVTVYDGSGAALARTDGTPASTTFLYQRNAPDTYRFGFADPQSSRSVNDWPVLRFTTGTDNRTTTRDLLDMNGDGVIDLVDTGSCGSTGVWKIRLGSRQGFASTTIDWTVPNPSVMCRIRYSKVSSNDSWNEFDTVDLNGDSIPDFVDATVLPYRVYFGVVRPGGESGYFASAQSWSAPGYWPRHSRLHQDITVNVNGVQHTWRDGSLDVADLFDVNGDGLPDLVQTPFHDATILKACENLIVGPGGICPGTSGGWTVWFNTGSGFRSTATSFPAGMPLLRYVDVNGIQVVGTFDLNGDGLTDQVVAFHDHADTWLVYQNTGYRLALGGGDWRVPDDCGRTGLRDDDENRVTRDLLDINGDGQLDVVTACGTTWQVRLGQGSGFAAQARPWPAPWAYIRDGDRLGEKTERDTLDVDGDGMADFIDFARGTLHRNLGGAWANICGQSFCWPGTIYTGLVENPPGGKPDLLVQVENGIGGTTNLDYKPSTVWDNTDGNLIPRLPVILWSVTHIEQDDGLCRGTVCLTTGSHSIATDFAYSFGVYDALAREFRGYRTVRQTDAAGVRRDSYFHQDGARKGKLWLADTFAAGGVVPIHRSTSQWECAASANGPLVACPDRVVGGDAISVRLKLSTESDGGTQLSSVEQRTWDACGNVTESVRTGLSARSRSNRSVYSCSSGSSIVDRPIRLWSIENAGSSNARILDETWIRYDGLAWGAIGKGNVTSVHRWLDGVVVSGLPSGEACPGSPTGGVGGCVSTSMQYDAVGNVTTVTDANGNSTTTIYDAPTNIYPLYVTSGSGAALQQTRSEYDPKCGRLLRSSNPYPAVAGPQGQPLRENVFDSFCRLHEEWEPYPGVASNVRRRIYSYPLSAANGEGVPYQVVLQELVGGDPRSAPSQVWMEVHRYFDALGRPLQLTRSAVVDGIATYVVEGSREYDHRGNVVRTLAPFQASGSGFVAAVPPGTGVSLFEFDALRRPTRVTRPDGSFRTSEYSGALQVDEKDGCFTSGTCPGSETISILDGLGRVVETRQFEKTTAGALKFLARSMTNYDALGRGLEAKQGTSLLSWNESTKVSTRYDSLGRRIQVDDPDSGSWLYGYDLVGNLIYQDDPTANRHRQLCYDSLNRPAKRHNVDAGGGVYASYQADLCRRESGQIRYTYGEISGPTFGRLIAVDDPSTTTVFDYDVRGRTRSLSQTINVDGVTTTGEVDYDYDAADHLLSTTYPDGEIVKNSFDAAGQLVSVAGSKVYLSRLTYDLFGRPLLAQHGNGTNDTYRYGVAAQNFRLSSLQTQSTSGSLLSFSYDSYDRNGLLTRLVDLGPMGSGNQLDNGCTYTYDGIGRLVAANGAMVNATYGYDGLGNMVAKEGVRLSYSATKPHTLSAIDGVTAGLAHDPNGNRTGKPGQAYTYTADDRLQSIVAGGAMIRFLYDYQGQRVAKVEPSGRVTRYYAGLAEAAGDYLTKYYYAGDRRIASSRVWAPQLAQGNSSKLIQVAQASAAGPGVILLVHRRGQFPLAFGLGVLGTALLAAPWRRKAVVGIRVRHGQTILVTFCFVASTLPVGLVPNPAGAATVTPTRTATRTSTRTAQPTIVATATSTRSASSTPTRTSTSTSTRTATRTTTQTPTRSANASATGTATLSPSRTSTGTKSPTLSPSATRTPPATPTRTAAGTATRTPTAIGGSAGLLHYHLDHLGSVQAITDELGGVVQYIRYKPYGEVRGHYDRNGVKVAADTCGDDAYCHEFTGYDSEPISGLQYAQARVYDPQLGLYLTHDPARQFASPYTYTNWNPVNATDPSGAEITLLSAIIFSALAGALASGVQAAVSGASTGDAFKAAALGGALGGLGGGVGFVVLQSAVPVITGALAKQLAAAGLEASLASNLATLSVNGSLVAAGVAQAGLAASRRNYSGLIGLGSSYGMAIGWDALTVDAGVDGAAMSEYEIRPGDIMGTNEGAYARLISLLDPTGDTGHTQMALERDNGSLAALTSDEGGVRVADLGDDALSGRGYTIYRPVSQVHLGTERSGMGLWGWIQSRPREGGLSQYLGHAGGDVCSSTVNSALQSSGAATPWGARQFMTPNQLVHENFLRRVGWVPLIP